MRWRTFLIHYPEDIWCVDVIQPCIYLSKNLLPSSLHTWLHVIAAAVYWFQCIKYLFDLGCVVDICDIITPNGRESSVTNIDLSSSIKDGYFGGWV
jgi:hypothetical protein